MRLAIELIEELVLNGGGYWTGGWLRSRRFRSCAGYQGETSAGDIK